jgi:AbrB family looped-hinge helix DNA binding protein
MKKQKDKACCPPSDKDTSCCTVTAVVTVDERGQIVLPKELRDKAHILAGDKLAVVAMGDQKEYCCLILMKTKELNHMVKIKIDAVLGKKKEN